MPVPILSFMALVALIFIFGILLAVALHKNKQFIRVDFWVALAGAIGVSLLFYIASPLFIIFF